jgi:ubiquitin C-terminal hydrolase
VRNIFLPLLVVMVTSIGCKDHTAENYKKCSSCGSVYEGWSCPTCEAKREAEKARRGW